MAASNPGFEKTVIVKPAETGTGYMGGVRFVGGRYGETMKLAPKEKVALMRKDISRLQETGQIPAGWKVRIRTDDYREGWVARVTVETSEACETIPSYDEFGDAENGSPVKRAGIALLGSLGGHCTRETYEARRGELQGKINGHRHAGYDVIPGYGSVLAKTPEATQAEKTIRAACEQYIFSDTNPMVDYFDTDGHVTIEMRQHA